MKKLVFLIAVVLFSAMFPGCDYSLGDEIGNIIEETEATKYSVTYNGNGNTGGAVPTDLTEYIEGQTVTVFGNNGILLNVGFYFLCWDSKVDCSGTDYTQDQTFTMGTSDVILYAEWEENERWSVTYDGNGHTAGSEPVDSTTYEEGTAVTVLGNSGLLEITGIPNYTFEGWNTVDDGSGVTYPPGSSFVMGTSTFVLYALWEEIPRYTLTYNGNGNTDGMVPEDSNTYEDGMTAVVLDNTDDLINIDGATSAYYFEEWNTQADGNGTSYSPGVDIEILSSNEILYAMWTEYGLGDTGPAGGMIFIVKNEYGHVYGDNDWKYMESYTWGSQFAPWDENPDPSYIPGTQEVIGAGEYNSTIIYNATNGSGFWTAAQNCMNFLANGFSDWFLPSKEELSAMRTVFDQFNYSGYNDVGRYWSSNDYSVNYAWYLNFQDGQFYTDNEPAGPDVPKWDMDSSEYMPARSF